MLIVIRVLNVLSGIISMLVQDCVVRFVETLKGLLYNVMMVIILMEMDVVMIVRWRMDILATGEVRVLGILALIVYLLMLLSYKLASHICMDLLS